MSVMTLKIRMPVDVRQKPKVKLRLRLIGEGGKSDQFYKQLAMYEIWFYICQEENPL